MIRTRLLVGSILALAAAGVLIVDDDFPPWFPCLFACLAAAGVAAGRELVHLFPGAYRPSAPLTIAAILLCLAANWYPVLGNARGAAVHPWPMQGYAFAAVLFAFTAALLASFLLEMARYREPGVGVPRLGATLLAIGYLGVLPCAFVQIRFLPSPHTGLLLALTIFVPKCNDIAAFFTGTFIGRHKMTPLLSPKKTWEGFAGGMIGSVIAAVILSQATRSGSPPIFSGGLVEAIAFGIVVGIAGVLGDLAESLIKRDCHTKDAARSIPGFGGLLDVVDSVLFAAPVAYIWFMWTGS
jgi:phosphatidate cytidylyltransferase